MNIINQEQETKIMADDKGKDKIGDDGGDEDDKDDKAKPNLQLDDHTDDYIKLDEEQEKAQRQRYIEKGKGKLVEEEIVVPTITTDNDDAEDDVTRKLAQEEYDFQYAMMLQAQEYPSIDEPVTIPWTPNQDVDAIDEPNFAGVPLAYDLANFLDVPVEYVLPEQMQPDTNPALQMDPSNWRRQLSNDSICMSKTLTPFEVISHQPRLILDPFEAAALSDEPELVCKPPDMLSKVILAFDEEDVQYYMLVTQYTAGDGITYYCITTGWDRFVALNHLREGDAIDIYRTVDERVSDEPFFVIKCFRKPVSPKKPNLTSDIVQSPKKNDDEEDGGGSNNGRNEKAGRHRY